jgi:hypothetical protein
LQVKLVLKGPVARGQQDLVELSPGLQLTDYHPVYMNGSWRFPCEQAKSEKRACDMVYNFMLAEHHVVWAGGIACATLGHGIEGDVIGHPFLGSYSNLSELERFESGVLHVSGSALSKHRQPVWI